MSHLKQGESLRCPKCGKTTALWQGADQSGWVDLAADGTPGTQFERDGFGHELRTDVGCGECSWEGVGLGELTVRLDRDGNELPEVHPDQLRIEAA